MISKHFPHRKASIGAAILESYFLILKNDSDWPIRVSYRGSLDCRIFHIARATMYSIIFNLRRSNILRVYDIFPLSYFKINTDEFQRRYECCSWAKMHRKEF